jgi:hypothetical protein
MFAEDVGVGAQLAAVALNKALLACETLEYPEIADKLDQQRMDIEVNELTLGSSVVI